MDYFFDSSYELLCCFTRNEEYHTVCGYCFFKCFLDNFFHIIPFFIPPIAALHDLYPLIPTNWTTDSWKGLLLIWSSYSGPEYLICLIPWIKPQQKMRKYLTYANALSTSEYLLLFIASLFFFGSNYLSKSKYPIIQMIRYLQSPMFERLDIILISLHMFLLVFAISIFLLCIYGATRIILKKQVPNLHVWVLLSLVLCYFSAL